MHIINTYSDIINQYMFMHDDFIDYAIQIRITELSKVASWIYSNKFTLNENKTQMIMFSRKKA